MHAIYHSIFSGEALALLMRDAYRIPEPITCTLLYSGVNETYHLKSPAGDFVLRLSRVHRMGSYRETDYRFELDLLRFLGQQGFAVPQTILVRDGEMLSTIGLPEGKRFFTLSNFLPGQTVWPMNAEQLHHLGANLARLHMAMDTFESLHERFEWNADSLLETPLNEIRQIPGLPPDDLALLESLAASLRAEIDTFPRENGAYGLLHGDYWWTNFHGTADQWTILDFDFCGWGWRAYELSALTCTARILGGPLAAELVAAYHAGYESIRPLSAAEHAMIPTFERVRLIWVLGLWASLVHVSGAQDFYRFFTRQLTMLRAWLQE